MDSAPMDSAPVESAPVESAPVPSAPVESAPATSQVAPPVESVVHDAPLSEQPLAEPPLPEPPASELPPTIDDRLPAAAAPSPAVPAPAPAAVAPAPAERPARIVPRREPPRPPAAELVLIETDAAATYLYWELSASVPQPVPPEQCSLLVVAHTPAPSGAQRVERRLSVTSASGALRLVGVPEHSVLRALLTREGAPHAQNGAAASKPLAVAGSVRAQEPPRDPAVQVTFSPTRAQNPADLAVRAIDRLAEASPVHW